MVEIRLTYPCEGSQFCHRLILILGAAAAVGDTKPLRVKNCVCSNAGWYTMPTLDTSFPYGLKDLPLKIAQGGFKVPIVYASPLEGVLANFLQVCISIENTEQYSITEPSNYFSVAGSYHHLIGGG